MERVTGDKLGDLGHTTIVCESSSVVTLQTYSSSDVWLMCYHKVTPDADFLH